ncbi:MAG: hypothetical protein HOP33_12365 [Verrucomicrobia bacterium]|nr:hypothetical protein [Verrucomicrobiota bacterium]
MKMRTTVIVRKTAKHSPCCDYLPSRLSWLLCTLILISGCATRTSPPTVKLETIRAKASIPLKIPNDTKTVFSVAIRFPSGFQDTAAKSLFTDKAKEMVTITDRKGRPTTNPYQRISFAFDPDETILKSMYAALQLRQCLCSNASVRAYLVPCSVAASNSNLILIPPSETPVSHAMIDMAIINPLASMPEVPAYKWQGCNLSYLFSPMVKVSVCTDHGEIPVAGTRRWLTKDGEVAVVLPQVIERRFRTTSGSNWGTIARNYPVLNSKHPAFTPSTTAAPGLGSYYEFDSFVLGDEKDRDFTPYWNHVAAIVIELSASTPVKDSDLLGNYSHSLGLKTLPESKTPLASKFLQAEWRFMQTVDESVTTKMKESNWFTGMDELRKSEDKYLGKAKSKFFWNQFGQMTFALAGAAAMGAASASAASSGTPYNANTTAMMNMSIYQNLSAANTTDQAKAYDIYKSMTGNTRTEVSEVMLGLTGETTGVTFKTIAQIREHARKKLASD